MNYRTLKRFPFYEFYEDGTIIKQAFCSKSGHQITRKKLQPSTLKNGYLMISLIAKNGGKNRVYVHRVIFEAFRGEIPKGAEIDHIDGNRQNASISNLRLCKSHKENCINPSSIARYKMSNRGKHKKERIMLGREKGREKWLRDLYKKIVREEGKCTAYRLLKAGHCAHRRAKRIVQQFSDAA